MTCGLYFFPLSNQTIIESAILGSIFESTLLAHNVDVKDSNMWLTKNISFSHYHGCNRNGNSYHFYPPFTCKCNKFQRGGECSLFSCVLTIESPCPQESRPVINYVCLKEDIIDIHGELCYK
jgi:hypothetical protein